MRILITLLLISLSGLIRSQSSSMSAYWHINSLSPINISNLQPTPCDYFFNLSVYSWPDVHLKVILEDYDPEGSDVWIMVRVDGNAPIDLSIEPHTPLIPSHIPLNIPGHASATAYVFTEGLDCICDHLDELETVVFEEDANGLLTCSIDPGEPVYMLVHVQSSNLVGALKVLSDSTVLGLADTDCAGDETSSDELAVVDWINDGSVLIGTPNPPCENAIAICGEDELQIAWAQDGGDIPVSAWIQIEHYDGSPPEIHLEPVSISNAMEEDPVSVIFQNITLYSVGETCGNNCGSLNEEESASLTDSSWEMPSGWISDPGTYLLYVEMIPPSGNTVLNLSYTDVDCNYVHPAPEPCVACLPLFIPESGKRYVVSAWVKETGRPLNTLNYTRAYLEVAFNGSLSSPVTFTPAGQIIDGWQRIEGEMEFPSDATSVTITPGVETGEALFDDLRFFPYDGSMKSYVYDPFNLRFVAELDERNYATFYEYDEEGRLTRIKKETERGVMTIQESKTSNVKKEGYND